MVFGRGVFGNRLENLARLDAAKDRERKTIKRQAGRGGGTQRREQGENGDLGNNKANPVPENRMTNDSNYIFSPVIMSFFMHPSSHKAGVILLSFRLLSLLRDTGTATSNEPSMVKPDA